LHKETKKSFSKVIEDLYNYSKLLFLPLYPHDTDSYIVVNPKNQKAAGMISKQTYETVMKHRETLDSAIIYNRDFNYNLLVILLNHC